MPQTTSDSASLLPAAELMGGIRRTVGTARMLTADQWEATKAQALAAGLGDAELAGLAIGCPMHGNAAMDWDDGEVFCYLIH